MQPPLATFRSLVLHQQESVTHQRPDRYTWSDLPPGDILMSEVYNLHLALVEELTLETWKQKS